MRDTVVLLCSAFFVLLCGTVRGEEAAVNVALFPRQEDMIENVPSDFPRFHFAGHSEEARLLSRYLWYHFANRGGNSNTLFNKEYLTTSDLWLGGAIDAKRSKSIQDVHREDLSSIKLDDEGYVYTHQHFSHAHDHGWPFPLWTQADTGPDTVAGKTVGWHFQTNMPDWMWVAGFLKGWKKPQYYGESATQGWELHNVKSLGIAEEKWQLEATGASPTITSPVGMEIEAFQAPYLQLRWTRTPDAKPNGGLCIEWLREGDSDFGEDRRAYASYDEDARAGVDKSRHLLFEMHKHPKWEGKIKRLRLCLAPGEPEAKFAINSLFTVYDTRHTINNPIFIFSCWSYFRWTGDVPFLRAQINHMRTALRYQQTEMGGLKHKVIRNEWPGHDGLAGYVRNPDGSKTLRGGHGIGGNYWDILPFGWDDMYATNQYYAATLMMADVEDAVRANPGWGIPLGQSALDPAELRRHAEEVKREANRRFWNARDGRFIACIDKEGKRHDYGFTFLNLDSIWYGLASDDHASAIMDWIDGKREIKGDTSTGADIYHWRFGPRSTTKRNVEWYGQGWYIPEGIPWGGQVQDGGAVLGFAFYDLWARLKVFGPDNAWERLSEILEWEKEVIAGGGYREYYKDGKRGTTLQGGGTAGGIGVDCEFFESSLIPSVVVYGFLGLDPKAAELAISPSLPAQCPETGMSNLLYRGCRMDIKATDRRITVGLKDTPADPISVVLSGEWRLGDARGSRFRLDKPGVYVFER